MGKDSEKSNEEVGTLIIESLIEVFPDCENEGIDFISAFYKINKEDAEDVDIFEVVEDVKIIFKETKFLQSFFSQQSAMTTIAQKTSQAINSEIIQMNSQKTD